MQIRSELITELSSDPRELFRTLETLLNGKTERLYPPVTCPEVLPNRFADYFEQKITNIRAELDLRRTELRNPSPDVSQEHSHVQLRHFTPVTTAQPGNLIGRTARKSCDLDPVPATVLRECLSNLLPIITKIVNVYLTEAVVPSSLKNASLHPLLKKASLPYDEFSSFRPVSNLSFISKCVEKVVATQTCMHVDDNNLGELYQSAYKKHHSTETALLKVQDDMREKNSRYFLNLEKRNNIKKHIRKLYISGSISTNPLEIMDAQKRFYSKLYSRKPVDLNNEETKAFLEI